MKTLLHIQSSLFGASGQSSRLSGEFVANWKQRHPAGEVIVRDLNAEPVPHLTARRFGAFAAKASERDPEQRAAVAYSDTLIGELKRADVVVLGLPMYNFTIPSTLKAYFDHVARAGVTFRYTDSGPEGLLKGKKAYVFTARGGQYAGTPLDTQTDYVRNFLAFLGIEDTTFVHAEGLAMGEGSRKSALSSARKEIASLTSTMPAAA